MKKLLLPLILALVGTGAGTGAGLFLAPEPSDTDHAEADAPAEVEAETEVVDAEVAPTDREYAKLNNQFVVPVVEDGLVISLVVVSLNLEVLAGTRETIFLVEPKLRDGFLQVMFDHANLGGFSGNFTTGTKMQNLRSRLLKSAQNALGDIITDVLIMDIVRQDS